MRPTALLVDFDGTLVDASFRVSQRLTSVAKQLDPSIRFGIVTGRSYDPMVRQATEDLGLTGPHVLNAGARVFDPQTNESLWQALLPATIVDAIIDRLTATPHDFLIEDDTNTYVGRINSSLTFSKGFVVHPFSELDHTRVLKIFARTGPDINDALTLKQDLLASIPGIRVVEFFHQHLGRGGVDIAMATKFEGVGEWLRLTDTDRAALVAVGDGRNDFPLLMASGWKIAMGNADPELKTIADEVVSSIADDGLATVIEKYFLNQ